MNLDLQKDVSLVAQTFQVLRTAILRGELQPGAKLKLDALQRTYGLSSSPLREALNRLVSERLVQADDGRGFSVMPISIAELQDLTRMRVLLEVEALRESIRHGDDAWEARIVAAFHRLGLIEERLGDASPVLNDEWSMRHRDSHMALLAACPSPRLLHVCGGLFDEVERYRRLSARLRERPRNKSGEHALLMNASLARDGERAAQLLTQHIQRTAENVAKAMEQSAPVVANDLAARRPAPATAAAKRRVGKVRELA